MMRKNDFYVKMDGEICGPYSEEEMAHFDIPADTPVVADDPEGNWHTYEWFDFQSEAEIQAENVQSRDKAASDIFFGLLWCVGGIVVTLVTYNAASNGGTYIIAWGAILFGGIQFLKGLFHIFI